MKTKLDWKGLLAIIPGAGVAVLPQLFCPACWPAYTALLSSLGVSFINYTPWLMPVTIIFLLLAVAMLLYQAGQRRRFAPFYLGLAAAVLILLGKFLFSMNLVVYGGVGLLISASIWNAWPGKKGTAEDCEYCEEVMKKPILESVLKCPECGFEKQETMPTDACQFFYECTHCNTLLKPKKGDCCVFCSYGTVSCPPIQLDDHCCSG